jgi:cobalt-zinc-cadmium resistance protein CzcA
LKLKNLLQTEEAFVLPKVNYTRRRYPTEEIPAHPLIGYKSAMIDVAEKESVVIEKEKLPDWNVGLFNGINSFNDFKFYPGVQAGIIVPLNQKQYLAKNNAAQLDIQSQKLELDQITIQSKNFRKRLESHARSIDQNIQTYDARVQTTATQLLEVANSAYLKNEIDYFEYISYLDNVQQISIKRMELLFDYNQTIIQLQYRLN